MRGWDAAKKTRGRKRHIVVDALGLILAVAITGADVQDRDGALLVPARLKALYCWLRVILADGAYGGGRVACACLALGLALVIVRRPKGVALFTPIPTRWVVERTFGWLGRWRRLARDYEELPTVSRATIQLAMIRLMLQRLAPPRRGKSRSLPNFKTG